MVYEYELEVAQQLAREAGALLLQYRDNVGTVIDKGRNSPQSEADRASNRLLVESLHARFPNDGILAEESPDTMRTQTHRRVWVIDPLDGTREFLDGIDQFVVQIGLVVDGRPVLGVVYQPSSDHLYYGIVGEGAWLEHAGETTPLRVSDRDDPATFRAVVSRSHGEGITAEMLKRLGITDVARIGSVGMKVAALLEQQAEVYIHPSPHTKLWDTAAPEAVLTAAGGVMTDCHGRPLVYEANVVKNLYGVVASNGRAHRKLISIVSPLYRE
nr:3'(2'),5'-bisphosphate nucleotidase CysQ [Ardenticatena sp.]